MFLRIKDVASRLKLSASQVYALIAAGKLSCHRFGVEGRGALRVTEEQLASFIEATTFTPKPPLPELRHIQLPGEQRPGDVPVSR